MAILHEAKTQDHFQNLYFLLIYFTQILNYNKKKNVLLKKHKSYLALKIQNLIKKIVSFIIDMFNFINKTKILNIYYLLFLRFM